MRLRPPDGSISSGALLVVDHADVDRRAVLPRRLMRMETTGVVGKG